MKYPISLSDSTPYFEQHFMLCEDSPAAYVSAYRDARFESIQRRRREKAAFIVLSVAVVTAWLLGFLHLIFVLGTLGALWGLNYWRSHHESSLLDRTFELAVRDKEESFREYMHRYRDRH